MHSDVSKDIVTFPSSLLTNQSYTRNSTQLPISNISRARTQSMPVQCVPKAPYIAPRHSVHEPPPFSLPAAPASAIHMHRALEYDKQDLPDLEPLSFFYSRSAPTQNYFHQMRCKKIHSHHSTHLLNVLKEESDQDLEIEKQLQTIDLTASLPRNSIFGHLMNTHEIHERSPPPSSSSPQMPHSPSFDTETQFPLEEDENQLQFEFS